MFAAEVTKSTDNGTSSDFVKIRRVTVCFCKSSLLSMDGGHILTQGWGGRYFDEIRSNDTKSFWKLDNRVYIPYSVSHIFNGKNKFNPNQ
jgi:hypothetical protein